MVRGAEYKRGAQRRGARLGERAVVVELALAVGGRPRRVLLDQRLEPRRRLGRHLLVKLLRHRQ